MTLVELTVVVLIVSILASISLSVLTNHVQRARFTSARFTIRMMDEAIRSYFVDLSEFPPSYSDSARSILGVTTSSVLLTNIPGTGNLMLALLQSMSGSANDPFNDPRWRGPYLEVKQSNLIDFDALTGAQAPISIFTLRGNVSHKDPWGLPYSYIRFNDYNQPDIFDIVDTSRDATVTSATTPFHSYFNPNGFQIWSVGPNGFTLDAPLRGLDPTGDDVTNF